MTSTTSTRHHPGSDAGSTTVPLSQYLEPVKNRWKLVAGIALAVTLAGIGAGLSAETVYRSKTSLYLNPITGDPGDLVDSGDARIDMATELRLVGSEAVIEKVGVALANQSIPATADELKSNVTASTTKDDSRIVDIAFTASTAHKAQAGADAFARGYLDYRVELAATNRTSAEEVLNARLAAIDEEWAEVSTRLRSATEGTTLHLDLTRQRDALTSEQLALSNALVELSTLTSDPGIVITSADLPSGPEGLALPVIIFGSLIAGLGLGVAAAVGIHALTNPRRPVDPYGDDWFYSATNALPPALPEPATPERPFNLDDLPPVYHQQADVADEGVEDEAHRAHEAVEISETYEAVEDGPEDEPEISPLDRLMNGGVGGATGLGGTGLGGTGLGGTGLGGTRVRDPEPEPVPVFEPEPVAEHSDEPEPTTEFNLSDFLDTAPVFEDSPSPDDPAPFEPAPTFEPAPPVFEPELPVFEPEPPVFEPEPPVFDRRSPIADLADPTPEPPTPEPPSHRLGRVPESLEPSSPLDALNHVTAPQPAQPAPIPQPAPEPAPAPVSPAELANRESIAGLRARSSMQAAVGHLRRMGAERAVVAVCVGEHGASASLAVGFDLADAVQELGARVLLIDLNMTSPVLNDLIRCPLGPGLADVMAERSTFDQAVRSIPGLERLAVLTAGEADIATGDHLGGAPMINVLRQAAERFHVIILVTGSVDETAQLTNVVGLGDGVIVGVDQPEGDAPSQALVDRLAALPTPVLELISIGAVAGQASPATSGVG